MCMHAGEYAIFPHLGTCCSSYSKKGIWKELIHIIDNEICVYYPCHQHVPVTAKHARLQLASQCAIPACLITTRTLTCVQVSYKQTYQCTSYQNRQSGLWVIRIVRSVYELSETDRQMFELSKHIAKYMSLQKSVLWICLRICPSKTVFDVFMVQYNCEQTLWPCYSVR